jgi:hypothetical protein
MSVGRSASRLGQYDAGNDHDPRLYPLVYSARLVRSTDSSRKYRKKLGRIADSLDTSRTIEDDSDRKRNGEKSIQGLEGIAGATLRSRDESEPKARNGISQVERVLLFIRVIYAGPKAISSIGLNVNYLHSSGFSKALFLCHISKTRSITTMSLMIHYVCFSLDVLKPLLIISPLPFSFYKIQ